MIKYFVYKITNLVNNKIYIGKTCKNIKNRFESHKIAAIKKTPGDYFYIHRAMNYYGIDNFIIEELASFNTDQEAKDAETLYIKQFNSKDKSIGYNLTNGGDGVSGCKWPEESRKKFSNSKKGKCLGKDNPFYGKKHTKEYKQKMSIKRQEMYLSNKEKIDEQNIKQCKFTRDECLEIQTKYLTKQYSMKRLSEEYNNCGLVLIHKIITGKYMAIKGHSIISDEEFKNIKQYKIDQSAINYSKFTETQQLEIVKYYSSGKFSLQDIANKFGCSGRTISNVLKRRNIKIIRVNRRFAKQTN